MGHDAQRTTEENEETDGRNEGFFHSSVQSPYAPTGRVCAGVGSPLGYGGPLSAQARPMGKIFLVGYWIFFSPPLIFLLRPDGLLLYHICALCKEGKKDMVSKAGVRAHSTANRPDPVGKPLL